MKNIKLTVNGEQFEEQVDNRLLLVDFLRDNLSLTGTHVGCTYEGVCGACTIHLDGDAVKSCMLLAVQADGHNITTIEGLADSVLSPVQEAWAQHNVAQCGYCQSGQMMSAAALLAQNNDPSDAEIDSFMQGNICRCGTYQRIKVAIKSAARKQVVIKNAAAKSDVTHVDLES